MQRIMTADNTNSPEQVISKSQNVSGTAGGPEGQSVKQGVNGRGELQLGWTRQAPQHGCRLVVRLTEDQKKI